MYTDGGKQGDLFLSGFIAGLNADSSVNVILVPYFLPVLLKPAYKPFDSVALSQEVLLQRSLQFLKTSLAEYYFSIKITLSEINIRKR